MSNNIIKRNSCCYSIKDSLSVFVSSYFFFVCFLILFHYTLIHPKPSQKKRFKKSVKTTKKMRHEKFKTQKKNRNYVRKKLKVFYFI